ncbi:MAG: sulfite exporter TauE/SafE family protein [Steroidobacteraceae bacterium]
MSASLLVLASAFLSGLMGGGHCAVMCGGIATGFSGMSGRSHWLDALEPNVGRIMAYTVAGAVAGGLGHGIVTLARSQTLLLTLRTAVGLVLVITALRLLLPRDRFTLPGAPGRLWQRLLQPLQRRLLPADTPLRRMAAGIVWGFLPCGLSTTVLAAAWLQSRALDGAMIMLAFGLGTLPVMVPLTWSGARIGQALQREPWRIAAGSFVMLAGLVTLTAPLLMKVPALHTALAALGCLPASG